MLSVGVLLLGIQDGSVDRSVLLRGLVSGNPKVVGHTAHTLARAGHFASLRGGEDLGHTAAAADGGSWAAWRPLVCRLHVAASSAADGRSWPWIFVHPHEVTKGGGSEVGVAVARG